MKNTLAYQAGVSVTKKINLKNVSLQKKKSELEELKQV
jgi:hypothetical protein